MHARAGARLPHVRCPTLIVRGARDAASPHAWVEELLVACRPGSSSSCPASLTRSTTRRRSRSPASAYSFTTSWGDPYDRRPTTHLKREPKPPHGGNERRQRSAGQRLYVPPRGSDKEAARRFTAMSLSRDVVAHAPPRQAHRTAPSMRKVPTHCALGHFAGGEILRRRHFAFARPSVPSHRVQSRGTLGWVPRTEALVRPRHLSRRARRLFAYIAPRGLARSVPSRDRVRTPRENAKTETRGGVQEWRANCSQRLRE